MHLCTLLREYKTPVPHLKADKRISSTRKDNYAHISYSNIKKKKKIYTPMQYLSIKMPPTDMVKFSYP